MSPGRPQLLPMTENENRKQQLEAQLRTATGAERRKVLRELVQLGGRRGAETRPRGEESEKR